jgi:hypothetical protein
MAGTFQAKILWLSRRVAGQGPWETEPVKCGDHESKKEKRKNFDGFQPGSWLRGQVVAETTTRP